MASALSPAQEDLQSAIQSLQSSLSKATRKNIGAVSFPSLSTSKSIDENASDLEAAIDNLLELQDKEKFSPTGGDKVKQYVRRWYRATYPFADLILRVSRDASQVILG